VALVIQALLATRAGLSVTQVAVLSTIACLAGLIGAKLYYLAHHPQQLSARGGGLGGMCLQGFVLAAVATIVSGALSTGVPVGPLLDVTAPGLVFGIGIGRVGCFFGGCCAGRPTASRWGLWSSDRRLGLRRIPVQLMESALALLLGLAALRAVETVTARPAGTVFIAAIAAYTLGRQLLFPLRDLPRKTAQGRQLIMALSGLVLIADLTLMLAR
jgi:phosphatidylglycerol:prolipoprotein diacylglycerol transferase